MLENIYGIIPSHRRTKLVFWGAWRLAIRKFIRPFFQNPVIIKTPEGVSLTVSTEGIDEKILLHMLLEIPHWYFPKQADNLFEDPLILDIGAHRGYYSALALGHYPNSSIICIEPSQSLLKAAKDNIRLNGWDTRAEYIHGALAKESGFGILQTNHASWGYRLNYENLKDIKHENIPLCSLSAILGSRIPDIIKCNAEGGEYVMAKQLKELAGLPKLIIVMVHDGLGIGNSNDLISQMTQMGYRFDIVSGTMNSPTVHFWLEKT